MRAVTLCFLLDDERILLAMKKLGMGTGKWNGLGGKVEDGESIPEATVRELQEEIEVNVEQVDLEKIGVLTFFHPEKPEWNQEMHIFFARTWSGEPIETIEMAPKWFLQSEIPYDDMWADDLYWLPKALAGEKFTAECHFNEDSSKVEKFIFL